LISRQAWALWLCEGGLVFDDDSDGSNHVLSEGEGHVQQSHSWDPAFPEEAVQVKPRGFDCAAEPGCFVLSAVSLSDPFALFQQRLLMFSYVLFVFFSAV